MLGHTRGSSRRRAATLGLVAALAASAGAVGALPAVAGADPVGPGSQTFSSPGCSVFSVPTGVSSVNITATGSAGQTGGGGGGAGGTGDVVSGALAGLSAGQTLDVCVDYGGAKGGNGGNGSAGSGGGASGVALGSDFTTPVLIAAGGGGGGYAGPSGGSAGMPDGGVGGYGTFPGGDGGTQTTYGAGSLNGTNGGNGNPTTSAGPGPGGAGGGGGGNGFATFGGGGGGAGYYGGGGGGDSETNGGEGGGGGGGSDFCGSSLSAPGCQVSTTPNASYGTASVVLSYTAVATAPTITSASSTSFDAGQQGSFTVTSTGAPTPSLSESGTLPSGVSFTPNNDGTGTLSGSPASGSAGRYPITFTASNGVKPDDTQNFVLTVRQTATYSTQGCSLFSVPAGVSSVNIQATGSAGQVGGGGGGASGGTGDIVSGTLGGLSSGDKLDVCVNSGGASGSTGVGGDANSGSGGGASGVALGSDFTNPVLIAGGGGGGGYGQPGDSANYPPGPGGGGNAGEPNGGSGGPQGVNGPGGAVLGGGGGTQTSPGTGGTGYDGTGADGSGPSSAGPGSGGDGSPYGGGGGGGGLYGGGGGGGDYDGDGGGAGSDFCGPALSAPGCQISTTPNSSYGTASVVITYAPALPTPSISTSAQPQAVTVGGQVADEATVSGGASPTGTVTFRLYDNPNGTGTPLYTDANVPLSGGGAASGNYPTTSAGTDYWVATYNGDAHNYPVSSGAADEPVTVGQATPSISTSAQPASATVGAKVADQATVSGGDSPTGTVTFALYGNPNGTGTPLYTDANVPLSGGGATSGSYPTTSTGTDYWVATYNGDANNNSVTSGTADEPVTVGQATPSISTSAQPSSTTVGGQVADRATVNSGDSPSGTVTFRLYDNSSGTGTPLYTDADVPLSGGAAASGSYPTTSAGTDYWVATYNGDANNSSVSSGTADEPVSVGQMTPSISTSAQPSSVTVGGQVADQATVSGGDSPTGTVTFTLYDNSSGTGNSLYTDANEPLNNGSAQSASYTTTSAGTDYWVATYNGDTNNSPVSSGGGDEPVSVGQGTPSISTSAQPTSAVLGTSIADQATMSGGENPSGTVTFDLYDNSTGTGPALFTSSKPLSGGTATSGSYTPTATGTYYWVATYGGDANNKSVTSPSADEPVTITSAPAGGGGGGSGGGSGGSGGGGSGGGTTSTTTSTPPPTMQVVQPRPTSIRLRSAAYHVGNGQRLVYTATVAPAPDGGTVRFFSDGRPLAGCREVAINKTTGTAVCRTRYSKRGSHDIQAAYSGDAGFKSSQSWTHKEHVLSSARLYGSPAVSGDRVGFTIHCVPRSGGCRLTATLAALNRPGTVGVTRFSLAANTTRRITVELNEAGRKLLARSQALTLRLSLALTVGGQTSTVIQRTVTVRSPATHR